MSGFTELISLSPFKKSEYFFVKSIAFLAKKVYNIWVRICALCGFCIVVIYPPLRSAYNYFYIPFKEDQHFR